MRRFSLLVLTASVLPACMCGTDIDRQHFACADDNDCSAGFICSSAIGECITQADLGDAGSVDAGVDAGDDSCDGGCVNGAICSNEVCACLAGGGVPQIAETLCADNVDNDCNALTDCADSVCAQRACAPFGRKCQSGACECSGNGGVVEVTESSCADGFDNDCDGLADCSSPHCNNASCGLAGRFCSGGACTCTVDGGVSQSTETACDDALDNDCDGFIDCEESFCNATACGPNGRRCEGGQCSCSGNGGASQPSGETACSDSHDNDCDGLTDCADPQCVTLSCGAGSGFACQTDGGCACSGNGGTAQSAETTCGDGHDNDCDGLTDCADPSCNNQACGAGFVCQSNSCGCVVDGGVAQPSETSCNDNRDNDCDGLIDCQESSCNAQTCGANGQTCQSSSCACSGNGGVAQSAEAACSDAHDNDCDGLIDCADPSCNAQTCGTNGLKCQSNLCVCLGNGGTAQASGETICNDGFDNDCDALTDCGDPQCAAKTCGSNGRTCQGSSCSCSGNGGVTQTTEAACSDGHDNDCDGLTDCADSSCNGASCGSNGRVCQSSSCVCSGNGGVAQAAETSCSDGHDNDCDGLIDCADPGCNNASCGANGRVCQGSGCVCGGNGGSPQSTESLCSDGADNDCNGAADCADSACPMSACVLLGDKVVEGSDDSTGPGVVDAYRFTNTVVGSIGHLSVYLSNANTATSVRLAVYSDVSNQPSALLGWCTVSSTTKPAWNTCALTTPVSINTAGMALWLGAQSVSGSEVLRYDGSKGNNCWTTMSYSMLPASFGFPQCNPGMSSIYGSP